MSFFTSVAEIDRMLADLPPVDGATQNKVAARQSQLTKPPGSLGKLEDIAIWMAGWQRTEQPAIRHGQCLVFAGNHGVVAQSVSPFPAEVTAQMVDNAKSGGSAINQLCRVAELDLTVTPLQLDTPTNDITAGPALDRDEVLAAMNAGADSIADRCDYLIVGDMGIGNTTAAAALCLGGLAPMPKAGSARAWGLMMMVSRIKRRSSKKRWRTNNRLTTMPWRF
jgi:nicotinate-nucleotide--dimethylbenzimidazole phosphoribosyltransferase